MDEPTPEDLMRVKRLALDLVRAALIPDVGDLVTPELDRIRSSAHPDDVDGIVAALAHICALQLRTFADALGKTPQQTLDEFWPDIEGDLS